MNDLPPSAWGAMIALLLGVMMGAAVKIIAALKDLTGHLETLQAVLNGRLSQLVALTAVSSEAIGVEKGRLAEIARVISRTLPVDEPLLASTLAHFERKNGDEELVIPVPIPTPTVVIVPTEGLEVSDMSVAAPTETTDPATAAAGALDTATGQVADIRRQIEEEKKS